MEGSRGHRTVVIRVFDALMRDIMAGWLATMSGYLVVGAVSAGSALTRLCALRSPDVALVQLGPAEAEDLELLRGLRELRPAPHVIGLHGDLEPDALLRLHRAGVRRLVANRCGAAALRTALEETAPGPPAARTHGALSGRELEVLTLISAGCSTVDVADALGISPHTVVNHTRHIFTKLDVHSRMQAVAEAGRLGMCATTQAQRGSVVGPAGPLRDEVARILATGVPDARPAVTVLVHPTDSSWRAGDSGSHTIVVVEPGNHDLVTDAVARGARAVLSEEDVAERLPAVISLVRAGYLVTTDTAVRPLLTGTRQAPPRYRLTPRERDILDSIALGHSVRETAKALGIAVKTVQSEQRQLFAKLGVRNRASALAYARDVGLIQT